VNQMPVTVHGDELRGCQRPCHCLYLMETLLNVETDGTTEPMPLSAPSTTHHNQVSLDLHPITSQCKYAFLFAVKCQESNFALLKLNANNYRQVISMVVGYKPSHDISKLSHNSLHT